jgi:hypothetical protein
MGMLEEAGPAKIDVGQQKDFKQSSLTFLCAA